ncbi:hypothetical protein G9U51_01950 [Calidifontibacter sp. DB0510]|uniref:SAF domain-containing protein n=1 Tax=Metallococcus carri TaxID=1656884 RepID=A0A967E7V5_9MICO|nr:SAF domain-containing protein [Metallococcus carri]NHN54542.1 hypothetical protein [Metallococcus carri]NOP36619.1 SAF domain-containing protein [Calidifontibacter sp. DB2511S]
MAGLRRGSEGEPPTRRAQRLTRPSWRDGRLVAGVLLLVLATLLGALTLRHFDSSVQVLQATRTLVPGEPVRSGDLKVVKVRLDSGGAAYLRAGRPLGGRTVVREIRAGELVPASALASNAQLTTKAVAVPVDPAQAAALVRGSVVDVWVARKTAGATGTTDFQNPTREVMRAMVARVPGSQSGLSVASGNGYVQVLVPDAKVAGLIAAMNSGGKITLVPVSGSAQESS